MITEYAPSWCLGEKEISTANIMFFRLSFRNIYTKITQCHLFIHSNHDDNGRKYRIRMEAEMLHEHPAAGSMHSSTKKLNSIKRITQGENLPQTKFQEDGADSQSPF